MKSKVIIVLLSTAAMMCISLSMYAYDTGRYAAITRQWTPPDTSYCCSGCERNETAADGAIAWINEVNSHPGWSIRYYDTDYSYAEHFFNEPEIGYGLDHQSSSGNPRGFDYTDAEYVALHGMWESHNGKIAYRARPRSSYYGLNNDVNHCRGWMDWYDLGDDNAGADLEWLHLSSCHSMDPEFVTSSYSASYHQWSDAFDGLHSITGFYGVEVWPSESTVENFAEDAFDNIKDAWLTDMVNMSITTCDSSWGGPSTGHKRCPVWITYDETTTDAQNTMNNDDYTTKVGEPPGHGGNTIRLRAQYSSCSPCLVKE